MPSRWDAATHGWSRRVFHYPLPTLMSRNFRLPCTIELQPLSLTPLKMRKVEQSASCVVNRPRRVQTFAHPTGTGMAAPIPTATQHPILNTNPERSACPKSTARSARQRTPASRRSAPIAEVHCPRPAVRIASNPDEIRTPCPGRNCRLRSTSCAPSCGMPLAACFISSAA